MEYYKNISYLISHFFLFSFIYLFVPRRFSRRKTAAICVLSGLLIVLTDVLKLNLFPENEFCYVTVTVFQILVTQFTNIFLSSERDSRVFFMGLSASNYVIAGSAAATILNVYTKNAVFSLAVSAGIHCSILLFLYFRIREIWIESFKKEYLSSWWELCLIPVLFYCSITFTAFFPKTLDENPQNIIAVIFLIITMFVSYVVVLRYVESEFHKSGIYWKNMFFESYISGLERQYAFVEKSEKNLRVMRHDMRHYSAMIDSLLNQGEYDEIRKITEHINDVANENRVQKYCDNLIVNTVISNLAEKAHLSDIDIKLKVNVSRDIKVNSYELAVVIANLIENAIICVKDYEKKKRYVDGKIHCTAEYILLEIKNECEKEIIFDDMTGLPQSGKGKKHGLGMQSVQAFSEKTGGSVGCFCEDGIFQIMMFAKF